jgi:hypothetical protein
MEGTLMLFKATPLTDADSGGKLSNRQAKSRLKQPVQFQSVANQRAMQVARQATELAAAKFAEGLSSKRQTG